MTRRSHPSPFFTGTKSYVPTAPKGEAALEASIRDPRLAAAAELKSRAEKSLLSYIRLMWPVIEPGNPLRVGKAFQAIAEHLEAVHYGHIRNLLINCPPGFSKSTLTDVFFPTWEWGPKNRPDLRYISWAYGEHLTVRDNEKSQTLVNDPIYQALWGGRVQWNPRQQAKDYYKTSKEGFRIAAGVRGMGTGERGDRLMLDDPLDAKGAQSEAERLFVRNWFTGTLTSRVRNANPYKELVEGILVEPSACVLIMQRLHHQDPSGIILEQELDFEHLVIEMEYEGAAHPARKRQSKKRPGTLAWKPSRIGYVDWREAQLKQVDAITEAWINGEWYSWREGMVGVVELGFSEPIKLREHGPPADDGKEGPLLEWWGLWGSMWLGIARDVALLADPVRYSRAAVEEWKERLMLQIGSNAVASQFRQWPHEGEGDMFKPENWVFCDPDEVPGSRVGIDVRGWDLAASESLLSDGTGAVKMRWGTDRRFYVLHAKRVRKSPGGVKDFRDEIREQDGPTVIQDFPQDPGQAGVDQVRAFTQEDPSITTRSSPETGSKVTRAMPMSGFQEKKLVVIVRGPWNAEYIDELANFPNSNMSALVDGSSRAFNRLAAMPPLEIPGGSSTVAAPSKREQHAAALQRAQEHVHKPSPVEIDDGLDYDDDD